MALATVYCAWNYTIDVIAGTLLGAAVHMTLRSSMEALNEWTTSRTAFWHGGTFRPCAILMNTWNYYR